MMEHFRQRRFICLPEVLQMQPLSQSICEDASTFVPPYAFVSASDGQLEV